jgi:hypothetical protein
MQVEEQLLLPCPLCGLPNPRLYKFGGSWNISCDQHCGAKIWASTKSEAVAEWNGEPVNPALDACTRRHALSEMLGAGPYG